MSSAVKVTRGEANISTRQGGEIRILLSPITTGVRSGFLGTMDIAPGEYVSGHFHPFSDESVYVVRGTLIVDTGEERIELAPDEALLLPREMPHRYSNPGDESVRLVFHIGPLAPSAELGHVATEPVPRPQDPPPLVGNSR